MKASTLFKPVVLRTNEGHRQTTWLELFFDLSSKPSLFLAEPLSRFIYLQMELIKTSSCFLLKVKISCSVMLL